MQLTLINKREGFSLAVEVAEGTDTSVAFEATADGMTFIVVRDAWIIEADELDNAQRHRAAWLREATRHQHNAAHCAAMAMHYRNEGIYSMSIEWQRGANASAYNARCNLFAAMNIKAGA